jgi:hypothetical protein
MIHYVALYLYNNGDPIFSVLKGDKIKIRQDNCNFFYDELELRITSNQKQLEDWFHKATYCTVKAKFVFGDETSAQRSLFRQMFNHY